MIQNDSMRVLRAIYESVVLDPMMGTGTTGVAALSCSRNFVGIEKEKSTFDIARGRISEMDLF